MQTFENRSILSNFQLRNPWNMLFRAWTTSIIEKAKKAFPLFPSKNFPESFKLTWEPYQMFSQVPTSVSLLGCSFAPRQNRPIISILYRYCYRYHTDTILAFQYYSDHTGISMHGYPCMDIHAAYPCIDMHA